MSDNKKSLKSLKSKTHKNRTHKHTHTSISIKELSYQRENARRSISVEILSTATQL